MKTAIQNYETSKCLKIFVFDMLFKTSKNYFKVFQAGSYEVKINYC